MPTQLVGGIMRVGPYLIGHLSPIKLSSFSCLHESSVMPRSDMRGDLPSATALVSPCRSAG